jgi:hypothetical protein
MNPLKLTFCVLSALVLAFFGWSQVFSYRSQHSGPFAYFRDAPGDGAITERGERVIAEKLQEGATAAEAERLLREAGFDCHKSFPPKVLPARPVPDKNGSFEGVDPWLAYWESHGNLPAFHLSCIWFFGSPVSWWQNSFFADEQGRVVEPYHRVTDGPDV